MARLKLKLPKAETCSTVSTVHKRVTKEAAAIEPAEKVTDFQVEKCEGGQSIGSYQPIIPGLPTLSSRLPRRQFVATSRKVTILAPEKPKSPTS